MDSGARTTAAFDGKARVDKRSAFEHYFTHLIVTWKPQFSLSDFFTSREILSQKVIEGCCVKTLLVSSLTGYDIFI